MRGLMIVMNNLTGLVYPKRMPSNSLVGLGERFSLASDGIIIHDKSSQRRPRFA